MWNRGPSKKDLQKEVVELRDKVQKLEDINLLKEITPRPEIDYKTRMKRGAHVRERDAKWIAKRYEIHNECVEMATATLKLKQETFRNGHEWEPKFAMKCLQCGAEYQDEITQCKKCGSKEFRKPTFGQYDDFEAFMKSCNLNGQAAYKVWAECEDDVNIIDDLFLLILKDYAYDEQGTILFETTKEWLRGDPIKMRLVCDERGIPGGKYWTCIEHRDEVIEQPGQCSVCGMNLHEVFYISEESSTEKNYFIKGEVIHTAKYAPTKLYSANPPAQALYRPAFILNNMSAYIALNYLAGRKPKSIVGIVTNNPKEAYAMWDEWLDKSALDPHYAGMIAVQPGPEGKGEIKQFSLQDTLEEMQYTTTRDEYRQRIFGYYGVAPVMAADVSVSGGLNNEGLQLAVTNRAIEMAQAMWNKEVFPKLLEMWNITDWVLKLRESEEQDIMAEIQQDIARAQHAQIMLQMGFEVKRNEQGEFEFSKEPVTGGYSPMGVPSTMPSYDVEITPPSTPEIDVPRQTGMPQSLHRSLDLEKFEGERQIQSQRKTLYEDLRDAYMRQVMKQLMKLKKRRSKLSEQDLKELTDELTTKARLEMESIISEHIAKTYRLGLRQGEELFKTEEPTKTHELYRGKKRIPINKITRGDPLWKFQKTESGWVPTESGTQTRIDMFAEDIRLGKADTQGIGRAIVVRYFPETDTYELWDGAHRVAAHTQLGHDYIEAEVWERKEGEAGLEAAFDQRDEAALKTLEEKSPLWPAFDEVDTNLTFKIHRTIEEAYADPEGFNIDTMVNKMREEVDVETYRLERIARTETTVVSAAGRESGFEKRDPEGEYRYKWEGPVDSRTSDVCRLIDKTVQQEGAGKGVSLERLKTIMRDASRRYNGAGWIYRDWAPHVNCRRSLVRVV